MNNVHPNFKTLIDGIAPKPAPAPEPEYDDEFPTSTCERCGNGEEFADEDDQREAFANGD